MICTDRDVSAWTITRAKRKAADRVRRQLRDQMATVLGLFPCPNCGEYQPEMIAEYQNTRYSGEWEFGRLLIKLGAGLAAIPSALIAVFCHDVETAVEYIGAMYLIGLVPVALGGLICRIVRFFRSRCRPEQLTTRQQRMQYARRTRLVTRTPAVQLLYPRRP